MAKINKRQIAEIGDTSVYINDSVAHTYSTSTPLLSCTLTNAPPGDYLVDAGVSCQPAGSGNCSIVFGVTGSSGTLNSTNIGIHNSDSDYSSVKYAHRASTGRLLTHPGGTFSITLNFAPETAVNFVFGNAGDSRWASYLRVGKAG